MTTPARAEEALLADLAARGPARSPATLAEIWNANWQASGLDTLAGVTAPYRQARDELVNAYNDITGDSLRPDITIGDQEIVDRIRQRMAGMSDQDRARLDPLLDIRGRAGEIAAEWEREAADVNAAGYGLSAAGTAFLAGTARAMVDPPVLGSMLIAGPASGTITRAILREAAVAAGTQAVMEPGIQSARADLGLEAGVDRALVNIATAGAGAGTLTGIFRGAGVVLRRVREQPGAQLPEAIAGLEPEDFEAAARLAERNALMDIDAPRTPSGRSAAADAVDRATQAVETGRPLPRSEPVIAPGRDPGFATYRPQMPGEPPSAIPDQAAAFASRVAAIEGDRNPVILPGGARLETRPAVVEIDDLTVSNYQDGRPNPFFPEELQPRDRSSAASQGFIRERAARLEPELLGRSPTVTEGAPMVGPDGVVEAGNGRAMMIARAYDRHPERSLEYRKFLEDQGYDLSGFKRPALVRIRETEVPDRGDLAKVGNVPSTAKLSPVERARADAGRIDDQLLSLYQPGEVASAANAPFVRGFVNRVIPAEDAPEFMTGEGRLSQSGAERIEAALVARAWGDERIVKALYEATDPTSRSILGAFADTAPVVSRLRAAVDEGRVSDGVSPVPALLDAYRLVDRARKGRRKVGELVDQADLQKGEVSPDVRAAVDLYFRNDALTIAAGRRVVSERIEKAVSRALDTQLAVGDLFGAPFDRVGNLRAAKNAGTLLDDLELRSDQAAPDALDPDGDATPPAEAQGEIGGEVEDAVLRELIEEMGEDAEIILPDADGEMVRVRLVDAAEEARDYAEAAKALSECVALEAAE